ncbi:MAG: hypothetical protein NTV61_10370 [Candidatus Bathyarchaeota archaeon]|nr:hypothetical protein [Candidatus Bathyarchaeota archaeon]
MPILVIIIIVVTLSGLNVLQYRQSIETDTKIITLEQEKSQLTNSLSTLQAENTELKQYFNISIFNTANSMRKFYEIWYSRVNTSYPPRDSGTDKIIFYVFEKNSTLNIDFYMNPVSGLVVPLTLQRGDATKAEYATEIYPPNPNWPNTTIRFAPVYWAENVSLTTNYPPFQRSIRLNDSGWYTISVDGVRYMNGSYSNAKTLGLYVVDDEVVVLPVLLRLSVHLSKDDDLFRAFVVRELN